MRRGREYEKETWRESEERKRGEKARKCKGKRKRAGEMSNNLTGTRERLGMWLWAGLQKWHKRSGK